MAAGMWSRDREELEAFTVALGDLMNAARTEERAAIVARMRASGDRLSSRMATEPDMRVRLDAQAEVLYCMADELETALAPNGEPLEPMRTNEREGRK